MSNKSVDHAQIETGPKCVPAMEIFEALTTVADGDIELYTPKRVKELLKEDN